MAAFDLVLFDLDGVIRHFDPGHVQAVEARHGLAEGSLWANAFAEPLISDLVTGVITRAQWTTAIGAAIGSDQAAEDWLQDRGVVDDEMLALIDEIRSDGVLVAILTNGTDTIQQELADFGVVDRFDAVFSTADIGVAKPDVGAFRHVCEALNVNPERTFFTDDGPTKLAGAIELGMVARTFIGVDDCRRALQDHGVAHLA